MIKKSNQDGYMVVDTTIDGCAIGADGSWQEKQTNETKTISKTTSSENFEFDKTTRTITFQ